ncbi:hypothetical protein B0H17DRAFT_928814 [Mycena rosella]|uniref:F-box domain-containing protein n=1 Tax=Mycena rosella TaxID=1033263 RepID=A0AAD7DPX2_MYCRO|nr:hypothetical protein B0H17DRAFT_928814 [Mycena rosella]
MDRSSTRSALLELPDDVLIYLFDLLPIPEILIIRKTCKRMQKISELRIVWTNACTHQILQHRYPFPDALSADLSVADLERHTRHAHCLATWWRSPEPSHPTVFTEFDATNGTPVSDLRFVPGHEGRWLLSESMGIWSILCLWELSAPGASPLKKFEWSRRDCLLRGFLLNEDPACEGALALSIVQDGTTHVEIMSLHPNEGFRSIARIESALTPLYLHGDTLVLCDSTKTSLVTNWRTGTSAILRRPDASTPTGMEFNDDGIQVVIAPDSILVVRARSLALFPNPPLTKDPPAVHAPLAEHSFGWVDGVAVTSIPGPPSSAPPVQPLSILIRPEPDDPWAGSAHSLELYVLHPAQPPSRIPYAFPPTRTARVPSARGALQCRALRFGPHGSAMWVEPQDRSAAGLALMHLEPELERGCERLVCAAFPGPLVPRSSHSREQGHGHAGTQRAPRDARSPLIEARTLRANALNNWNAMDYDEVCGRVAVGSTRGKITVLALV